MREELDKQLCEKYPILYKDRHGDRRKTCMRFGFSCGDGWFKIIDELSARLEGINKKRGEDEPKVVAAQVKEKFGGLRFYIDGGDDEAYLMIDGIESLSFKICEFCGEPGRLREGSWLKTRCDKCQADHESANFKMYILVKESIKNWEGKAKDLPAGSAMVAVAHASLACYLKFKDAPNMVRWLAHSFKKVVCKVSDEEFEKAKELGGRLKAVEAPHHVVMTESMYGNQEVAIAFCPREEGSDPFFENLKLYK